MFRHSSVGYEQYATLSSKAYLTSCITRGSQFVRCSLQEFKASREIAGDLCPIYKLAFLPRKGGEEKEAIHPIKRCQIGRTERLRILIPPVPSQAGRGRLPSPLLERRLSTTFGHFSPPATINVRRNPNLQCWAGRKILSAQNSTCISSRSPWKRLNLAAITKRNHFPWSKAPRGDQSKDSRRDSTQPVALKK